MRSFCVLLATLFFLVSFGRADTLILENGREIECVVLKETAEVVTIRRGYGVLDYPRTAIREIRRSPVVELASQATTQPAVTLERMPTWSRVVDELSRSDWVVNLRQIPATVIDVGVMRAVPYQSYQCGDDYEINIYGDPDAPVAIEIGVYRSLLTSDEAKSHCIELIAACLTDPVDASILRVLDRNADLVVRDGLTIEITSPDSPDAYGGWWVSIYREDQLDTARATEAELQQITVARTSQRPSGAKPSQAPARRPVAQAEDGMPDWTEEDLARARDRSASSTTSSNSRTPSASGSGRSVSPASSGGRVYVRGYYRKDGTYVRPHSRRR